MAGVAVTVADAEDPAVMLTVDGLTPSVKLGEPVTTPEVTVSPVEPVMEPDAAVMVVVPAATAVAKPLLLIVAALVVLDFHVTELVMFSVVPLL